MALFVNQENTRTKLQQRIAADLAEKAKKKAQEDEMKRPDGVDDAAYLKDTKTTTSLAWVWALIGCVFVGVVVWLVVISL
jgi:Flp pilus assembly protein TadB